MDIFKTKLNNLQGFQKYFQTKEIHSVYQIKPNIFYPWKRPRHLNLAETISKLYAYIYWMKITKVIVQKKRM